MLVDYYSFAAVLTIAPDGANTTPRTRTGVSRVQGHQQKTAFYFLRMLRSGGSDLLKPKATNGQEAKPHSPSMLMLTRGRRCQSTRKMHLPLNQEPCLQVLLGHSRIRVRILRMVRRPNRLSKKPGQGMRPRRTGRVIGSKFSRRELNVRCWLHD